MLNDKIKKQLLEVFKVLGDEVILSVYKSEHVKQKELLDMLNDLEEISNFIKVEELEEKKEFPSFKIKNSNVYFNGIPNGHEFSSLVLAILNSNLKGKIPDDGIVKRIKNLKDNIEIETYISLTCENCPEVVQSLNLISFLHGNLKHTMIDGQYFQDETKRLNIQGVPHVRSNNKMLLSGKTSLIEILDKLEQEFGVKSKVKENSYLGNYDVLVIGGGPAGISSAIYSARKGLSTVLVSENLGGQVKETKGIENLISVPYIEGKDLTERLRIHLESYNVKVFENRRIQDIINEKDKKIILNTNEYLNSKSVIVATGSQWRRLGVEGEKEFLGRGVAYCPICDGPFYKGKDVVVVGGGNSGIEAAIDLSGIVKSVTVLEFSNELKADNVLIDKAKNIDNIKIKTNAQTLKLKGKDKLEELIYLDRKTNEEKTIETDGVFVQIGLVPNSQFLKDIVQTNQYGEIIIDDKCRTNIKGIYGAGDVTTVPYKQIVVSIGEGAKASLTAFEDLVLK